MTGRLAISADLFEAAEGRWRDLVAERKFRFITWPSMQALVSHLHPALDDLGRWATFKQRLPPLDRRRDLPISPMCSRPPWGIRLSAARTNSSFSRWPSIVCALPFVLPLIYFMMKRFVRDEAAQRSTLPNLGAESRRPEARLLLIGHSPVFPLDHDNRSTTCSCFAISPKEDAFSRASCGRRIRRCTISTHRGVHQEHYFPAGIFLDFSFYGTRSWIAGGGRPPLDIDHRQTAGRPLFRDLAAQRYPAADGR